MVRGCIKGATSAIILMLQMVGQLLHSREVKELTFDLCTHVMAQSNRLHFI